MPNIAQYNAQGDITPSDKGIQGAEIAGRRIGEFGHQIGASIGQLGQIVYQHDENMEVSNLAKTGTDMENNFLKGWADFTADPNNKGRGDLAQTYLQQHVDPLIEEWQGHARTEKGRNFALTLADRMRQHLSDRLMADQSALDTEHAHDNLRSTLAQDAAGAAMDPSSLVQRNGDSDLKIEALASGITNVSERERFIDELKTRAHHDNAMQAMIGTVNAIRDQVAQTGDETQSSAYKAGIKALTDPAMAEALGGELGQFEERIDQAVERGKAQFKSADLLAQKQQDDEGRAVQAQLAVEVTKAKAAGQPISPALQEQIYTAVQKYPRLHGEFDSLLNAIPESQRAAESGEFVQSDPRTEDAFLKRVTIPAGEPGALTVPEIIQAQNDKRLSPSVASRLLSQQEKLGKDPDLRQGYKDLDHFLSTAIKPQLTKSSGAGLLGPTVDLQGDVAYQEAVREAHQIFEGWLKAGKTPAEAVEIMSNPANNRSFYQRLPYFKNAAGSPDAATYFQQHQYPNTLAPGQTAQPATAPALPGGAVQPRKAGESLDAWKARTGG